MPELSGVSGDRTLSHIVYSGGEMTYCSMNLESLTKKAQVPKLFVVESYHVAGGAHSCTNKHRGAEEPVRHRVLKEG